MDSNNHELIHSVGEEKKSSNRQDSDFLKCDTYGGTVHVEWDPHQPITPYSQLPFFIEFLKTANLFFPYVKECPLQHKYRSPNSPRVIDVLGTLFLSALTGQKRYAHITSIRNDTLNPPLLGMTKIVSEDSARRAFKGMSRKVCADWQKKHLRICYEELLIEPWILDIDTTVKPLYGHQEGAEVGYNPRKPGRPSQMIHTFMIGQLRIVLDCEVLSGKKQSAHDYTMPLLWQLLDDLPFEKQPSLLRGDCAFGSEKILRDTEARNLRYLFKLKKTSGVKLLIDFMSHEGNKWEDAGQNWEGIKGTLQLKGWSKSRDVLILRRQLPRKRGRRNKKQQQLMLPFFEELLSKELALYEYQVLVTNLDQEILSLAQLYRDRADAENVFDELKNQWGWGGFVTRDLLRSQIMARIIAQTYNWWLLFVRFANREKHSEGITSRPLLLHGVARQTNSGRKKTFIVTPIHAKAEKAKKAVTWIHRVLNWIRSKAEQLCSKERWKLLLSIIFSKFLKGKLLGGSKLVEEELLALEFF